MLPRQEHQEQPEPSPAASPVNDLARALQELITLQQQQRPPGPMQLDARFQLPKFSGQMNGETVDSWIRSLSNYFRTCPTMNEEMKLQIASLQLEGLAQTWWDTHLENMSLVVELGEQAETNSTPITSWNLFCEALRERFYPPGYIQNLLAKWLQLRQLPNQSVQAYIDVFCKLRIQLHISDPDEVLIIKFNSGLLMLLRREVELFDSASLDKAFIRALAVERKVGTRIRYPQARNGPSSFDSSNVASASSPTPHRTPWCTFHKTNSHASADCRVLKNLRPQKTLFTEVEQPKATTPLPVVSLENPTEVDPSLILMTANAPNTSVTPLFTHNCQIKHELATLILDNGSQKNLVSQDLVARLCLPTTPHPHPY